MQEIVSRKQAKPLVCSDISRDSHASAVTYAKELSRKATASRASMIAEIDGEKPIARW
jgi:hypothetical protein